MRHRPVRRWFRPWVKRCVCGHGWFPCPDSITMDTPGPDPLVLRRNLHHWNAPTAIHPLPHEEQPLMTPGQRWRSQR
jgi:hypothetical protein